MSRSAYGLSTPVDEWWLQAQCRKEDPDLFFRDGNEARAEALHICLNHCPVLEQCRREARANPPVGAVQGGEVYTITRVRYGYETRTAPTCRHCWPERPIRPPSDTGACGEAKGYSRHIRRSQWPCEPCREAKRAEERQRRASALEAAS